MDGTIARLAPAVQSARIRRRHPKSARYHRLDSTRSCGPRPKLAPDGMNPAEPRGTGAPPPSTSTFLQRVALEVCERTAIRREHRLDETFFGSWNEPWLFFIHLTDVKTASRVVRKPPTVGGYRDDLPVRTPAPGTVRGRTENDAEPRHCWRRESGRAMTADSSSPSTSSMTRAVAPPLSSRP